MVHEAAPATPPPTPTLTPATPPPLPACWRRSPTRTGTSLISRTTNSASERMMVIRRRPVHTLHLRCLGRVEVGRRPPRQGQLDVLRRLQPCGALGRERHRRRRHATDRPLRRGRLPAERRAGQGPDHRRRSTTITVMPSPSSIPPARSPEPTTTTTTARSRSFRTSIRRTAISIPTSAAYSSQYPDRNIHTETTYDDAGNAIATTDNAGIITRTYYDTPRAGAVCRQQPRRPGHQRRHAAQRLPSHGAGREPVHQVRLRRRRKPDRRHRSARDDDPHLVRRRQPPRDGRPEPDRGPAAVPNPTEGRCRTRTCAPTRPTTRTGTSSPRPTRRGSSPGRTTTTPTARSTSS